MPKGTKAEVKKRQDQALRFNSQGLGATAIAERLGCAASTVRNYLRNGRLNNTTPLDGRTAAAQAKASSGTNNHRPRKQRVAKQNSTTRKSGAEPCSPKQSTAVRENDAQQKAKEKPDRKSQPPVAKKSIPQQSVAEQSHPEQNPAVRESADPESISLVHELRRLLAQVSEDDLSQSRARHLMDCALRLAEKGDFKFFKEILDRIDGKSPAHVGGDDDSLAQLPEDELDRLIALAHDGTQEAQAQG